MRGGPLMVERRDAWIDEEYGDCVPPSPPLETHRGGPESVEQDPVVEPFGDVRDEIARQVTRGGKRMITEGESLRLRAEAPASAVVGMTDSVVYDPYEDQPDAPEPDNRAEFARWWEEGSPSTELAALPGEGAGIEVVDGEPPEDQQFTDIGFSRIFEELHRQDIRFIPRWKQWIVWAEQQWNTDHGDVLVTKLAEDVAAFLYSQIPNASVDQGKKLVGAMKQASKLNTIRNFVTLTRGAEGVRAEPDDLDSDPWLFGVENGYVNLQTGTFHEPDQSKLITKVSPVKYDSKAEAPTFMSALKQWHPDAEVREYLHRLVGHAMAGEYRGDHVLGIHYGGGRNGKGTFVKALKAVFGPYFVVPHKALLMQLRREEHATIKATLFRARLAVASETEQRHRLNEADVKNLTGGDEIGARRVYEDEWSFEPTHSLWLQTNHLPEIKGTDTGIWSRIRVVPWLERFEGAEKNPNLDDELRKELPGILNWAIKGCLRWQDDGLDNMRTTVRQATDEYHESEDVLARFMADREFELVRSPRVRCSTPSSRQASSPGAASRVSLRQCSTRRPAGQGVFGEAEDRRWLQDEALVRNPHYSWEDRT